MHAVSANPGGPADSYLACPGQKGRVGQHDVDPAGSALYHTGGCRRVEVGPSWSRQLWDDVQLSQELVEVRAY
eukprot:1076009-Heterocapsa_arctica.AAC.1